MALTDINGMTTKGAWICSSLIFTVVVAAYRHLGDGVGPDPAWFWLMAFIGMLAHMIEGGEGLLHSAGALAASLALSRLAEGSHHGVFWLVVTVLMLRASWFGSPFAYSGRPRIAGLIQFTAITVFAMLAHSFTLRGVGGQ